MANIGNIGNLFGGLFSGIAGFSRAQAGADLAIAGGQLQAQAFYDAATINREVAGYNVALEELNFNRKMDAFSRQINSFMSSQEVSAAKSGLEIGSKSFQAVANDTMDQFERFVLDARNTNQQKKEMILFDGEARAVANTNKGLAAEFNAQVAAYQQQAAAASAFGSMIGKTISGFGSLLG